MKERRRPICANDAIAPLKTVAPRAIEVGFTRREVPITPTAERDIPKPLVVMLGQERREHFIRRRGRIHKCSECLEELLGFPVVGGVHRTTQPELSKHLARDQSDRCRRCKQKQSPDKFCVVSLQRLIGSGRLKQANPRVASGISLR